MKNLLRVGLVSFVTCLSWNTLAHGECKQANVTITDDQTGEKAEMILFCDGEALSVPDSMNLSFVKWSGGQLCTAIKDCSNVRSWSGTFAASTDLGIGVDWVLGDFENIEFEGGIDYDVFDFEVEVSVGGEDNFCKPIKKECIKF